MFGSLGFQEILLIFLIALIIFGPRRLPQLGKSLGRAMGEFRKASDDLRRTIESEIRVEEMSQEDLKLKNLTNWTAPSTGAPTKSKDVPTAKTDADNAAPEGTQGTSSTAKTAPASNQISTD